VGLELLKGNLNFRTRCVVIPGIDLRRETVVPQPMGVR